MIYGSLGGDLAKIMAMSKEERDLRKDEIISLQNKIAKNEKYLDPSLKNLSSSAQQLLYTQQQRQELEKQNAEREKENKTLKDLYDFNRLILNDVLIKHYKNLNVTDILEQIRESSILFDEIIKQLNHHKENLISIKNEMNNALTSYILDTEK